LILARIDPSRKILDYASAGHIPAYVVNNTGEVIHTLQSTGMPLGFIASEKYTRSEPIVLKSGDLLALITDGITEAIAKDGSEFGYKRMIDIIYRHKMDTAQKISDHLTHSVCSFTDQQHQEDDITSVICKVD